MTATGWAWLAVAGVLAVLDWLAVARGVRLLERLVKPLVLLALIGAALSAAPVRPGVQGWLVAALVLGLIGDIALVAEHPARSAATLEDDGPEVAAGPDGVPVPGAAAGSGAVVAPDEAAESGELLFTVGLAAFLIGHLSYLKAMVAYGTDQVSIVFGLVLVLTAVLTFGYRILAGAQNAGGTRLTVAVTLYMVALGSSVVLGIGTAQLWIAAGAVLFGISDLILASDRFVQPRAAAPLAVIITYHLAQALLLVGLVS